MSWIKSLFIISVVSLFALKISDLFFGAIDYERSKVLKKAHEVLSLESIIPTKISFSSQMTVI